MKKTIVLSILLAAPAAASATPPEAERTVFYYNADPRRTYEPLRNWFKRGSQSQSPAPSSDPYVVVPVTPQAYEVINNLDKTATHICEVRGTDVLMSGFGLSFAVLVENCETPRR